jgi:hypothetical protein
MKWKKLGKIFDPTQHLLFNDCVDFAQSPQTVVFDDFVRIYFSTRKKDPANGKYLSHIAYVDMDKEFKNIINISSNEVIALGELGTFDEHGIFPINPLRSGDKVLAYTCGWSRRVSVSVETSVGLAISDDDGKTFKKAGTGPIMSSSLNEPFLVGDAFVKEYDGEFHMWYIYGTKWGIEEDKITPARVYKIAYAKSTDGQNWVRDSKQIIEDELNADECQALPTVVDHDGKYHMFFCYRQATGFRKDSQRGYQIGYAYSEDLVNWNRDLNYKGIEKSIDGWDSEMMCYPHVFKCDDKIYLLYNGNEFGKAGFGIAELEN